MDQKTLSYLLRIIKKNSDITPLRSLGYFYSQIVFLLIEALDDGYLVHEGLTYKLSPEGTKFLLDYAEVNNEHGIERWVLPRTNMMVTPLGIYDIVLPKKI